MVLGRGLRRTIGEGLAGAGLVLATACGSAEKSDNSGAGKGGASGTGGAAANATGGSSGAAATASGGAPATASGGANASGGAPASGGSGSCTGPFGALRAVLTSSEPAWLTTPTLSPDELELFYSRNVGIYDATASGTQYHFHRSTRASKTDAFQEGPIAPELDAACQSTDVRTIALTRDGLRAYIVCYVESEAGLPRAGTLRMARRVDLKSGFVLDAMGYGLTGASAAPSADELTVYSGNELAEGVEDPPFVYARSATTAAFGPGKPVPGLELTTLYAPYVTADGLALLGQGSDGIVMATRASITDSFSVPTVLLRRADNEVLGAPELSANCRSLYLVRVLLGTTTRSEIVVSERTP